MTDRCNDNEHRRYTTKSQVFEESQSEHTAERSRLLNYKNSTAGCFGAKIIINVHMYVKM